MASKHEVLQGVPDFESVSSLGKMIFKTFKGWTFGTLELMLVRPKNNKNSFLL